MQLSTSTFERAVLSMSKDNPHFASLACQIQVLLVGHLNRQLQIEEEEKMELQRLRQQNQYDQWRQQNDAQQRSLESQDRERMAYEYQRQLERNRQEEKHRLQKEMERVYAQRELEDRSRKEIEEQRLRKEEMDRRQYEEEQQIREEMEDQRIRREQRDRRREEDEERERNDKRKRREYKRREGEMERSLSEPRKRKEDSELIDPRRRGSNAQKRTRTSEEPAFPDLDNSDKRAMSGWELATLTWGRAVEERSTHSISNLSTSMTQEDEQVVQLENSEPMPVTGVDIRPHPTTPENVESRLDLHMKHTEPTKAVESILVQHLNVPVLEQPFGSSQMSCSLTNRVNEHILVPLKTSIVENPDQIRHMQQHNKRAAPKSTSVAALIGKKKPNPSNNKRKKTAMFQLAAKQAKSEIRGRAVEHRLAHVHSNIYHTGTMPQENGVQLHSSETRLAAGIDIWPNVTIPEALEPSMDLYMKHTDPMNVIESSPIPHLTVPVVEPDVISQSPRAESNVNENFSAPSNTSIGEMPDEIRHMQQQDQVVVNESTFAAPLKIPKVEQLDDTAHLKQQEHNNVIESTFNAPLKIPKVEQPDGNPVLKQPEPINVFESNFVAAPKAETPDGNRPIKNTEQNNAVEPNGGQRMRIPKVEESDVAFLEMTGPTSTVELDNLDDEDVQLQIVSEEDDSSSECEVEQPRSKHLTYNDLF